ncbi:hypothetical protein [Sphingobium fluviale]|uniref:Uncharacterized protein n=1 Tax=Sphingobium fluviale TaxID=2506423 RepID=A0A4Q1KGY0_9SPHN|nr:hypothetical protein [Sphingobium fluviale]RXR28817.1 hypothetical protein EQG66_08870 [Sphingobium fluviale]
MPQPISRSEAKSYSVGAKWVSDHRPECVAAIGLIAISWTRLEDELASMISGILGTFGKRPDNGWSINPNWIISTAMQETETIRARIKVVDAILGKVLETSGLIGEWNILSKRLYKRARDRNIAIHSVWAWSEHLPEFILKIDKSHEISKWNESDFINIYKRIHELEIDIHKFIKGVLEQIYEGIITSYVTK